MYTFDNTLSWDESSSSSSHSHGRTTLQRERTCACVKRLKERRYFFSPLQRSTRGGSSRRINAFVSRAIAGVFRAVDSVHCRNERASLEERRRVYEGHEPRLLQDLLLLFVSARTEKKLGSREGRDEMERRSLKKVRLKHTPCLFLPLSFFLFSFFLFPHPFSTLTLQLSLPRIRGFVRRYACLSSRGNR